MRVFQAEVSDELAQLLVGLGQDCDRYLNGNKAREFVGYRALGVKIPEIKKAEKCTVLLTEGALVNLLNLQVVREMFPVSDQNDE